MTPVDIARSFQPELLARAPEIEQARRLPADLAAKLAGAGLFRMLIPAGIGGLQSDPLTVAQAIERPSKVAVPRPISSRMTRLRLVA